MNSKLLFSIAVCVFTLTILASAQSPTTNSSEAHSTQTRGYWIDPSTGLMWAGMDNGRDVTWTKAIRSCRELRLAGYSDWRLADIEELHGIYDGSAYASLPRRKGVVEYGLAGRAKGGLLLTGRFHWSNTRVIDDRGRVSGYAWQFDFPRGKRQHEPLGYYGSKRALCVRRPQMRDMH